MRRSGLKHPCTSLQIYSESKFGFQAAKVTAVWLVVRQAHLFTTDIMDKSSLLLILLFFFTNPEIPDGFMSLIAQQLWASSCPTQRSQMISVLCLKIIFAEVAPENIDTEDGLGIKQ